MLCNTLIAIIVLLWAMGGHITYNALVATRNARPGRLTYAVTQLVWPFAALYAGTQ